MKVLAENKRARFDYEVLEAYEAGLKLSGQEVKSVKGGRMGLSGSHVLLRAGEAWLLNASIPPYQAGNTPLDYDPTQTRRLLFHKTELSSLLGRLNEKGLSLIPLKAYLKKNLVKLEVGLARSRKKEDKREYLKKREHVREMKNDA